jgi:hypothetical protein
VIILFHIFINIHISNGCVHLRPLQGALLTETVLLQEILGIIEDAFCYSAASVHLVKLL